MNDAIRSHQSRSLRVHELAHDFELLDTWRYPIEADATDTLASFDAVSTRAQLELLSGRGAAAQLFRLREALGKVFGWDRAVNEIPVPGTEELSLRERLSDAERARQPWANGDDTIVSVGELGGFRLVYQNEHEVIHEISNSTVHAIMHVSWVHEGGERYAPHMAVYVKHRGWLGRAYMAAIKPFRHVVVYPALLRCVQRAWQQHQRRVRALARPRLSNSV